jgi:hypothetical protein
MRIRTLALVDLPEIETVEKVELIFGQALSRSENK